MRDPKTPPDSDIRQDAQPMQPNRKPISMHEDVPVWHDCCSCEAEPYWLTIAEEPDLSSDAGQDNGKSKP